MRRLALVPTLIAALLLPSGAHALGLGEIEIQSALNQRLDAEIPLRGVPGGQGEDVEVSLASEEAFQNVGLDRPFALTRLQFTVKQRDGGAHYVHITSRESIVEPFLSFLVEVNWSGGNLLREYTVLLDPPVFTSEEGEDDAERSGGSTDTARTSEAGDGAGVTGEIERDAESTRSESEADDEDTRSASGSSRTGSGEGEDKPVFLEVEEREEREERARAEAERADESGDGDSASRAAGVPEQYGPVGDGETLWSIASRLRSGDMTVQQMMVALLRYNPDAFRGENINRLQKGYVLRVPDSDRVLEVSAQRALAAVREQNGVWRELQEGSRTETSVAASEQGAGDAGASGEGATGSDEAELSIVGADEGGASSDEAASVTGSSSEDESEKLQLTREQLESTRLEKEELASRVEELEQTVSKMEKLLEVRDERLSALQEELRELEGRESADDETETDVAAADDADEEAVDGDSVAESGDAAEDDAGDDDEAVAVAGGGSAEDGDSAATGTGGGSDDGETTVAEDGEAAGDETASADAADTGDEDTESAETTASAGEEADGDFVPEDKRATEEDRGFETTRTQEPEETWLDQVNGAIAAVTGIFAGLGGGLLGGPVGLGLAAAIVLLGGGLIFMRRRREAAESDDLDGFDPVDPNTDIAPFDAESSGRFEAQAPDVDDDGENARTAGAEDAQSALMEEQFDVASMDEEESADPAASSALDEPARGIDDEEAEKDDTVAEADVYLAYGLHQQAEDLLRLALREQPGNAMYHEKLLETLYASGKTEEFIEEAETFRGLVAGPESRLWQRVLAMGRDLAPRHELFTEGDTEYTAADVQPTRPAGPDLELDDAGDDIDFGLDDEEPESVSGGSGARQEDDEFSSTMMLDSGEFEAVEGDGGLVGPEDDRPQGGVAGTAAAADAGESDEDEDLEFDLGDLDALAGDEDASAPAAAGPDTAADDSGEIDFDLDDDAPAQSDDSARAGGETDDGSLDFDLDFDEPEVPGEGLTESDGSETPAADASASAESYGGGLDFDFDLEETPAESGSSTTAADDASPAEPAGGADDDPLEIGDLEIGDPDAPETESVGEPDTGHAAAPRDPETALAGDEGEADADTFDLSDLDTGLDAGAEGPMADENIGTASTGDRGAPADDAFDLSDLDAAGGAESDDDRAFNLDDLGAEAPESAESTPSTKSHTGESVGPEAVAAAAGADGASDEDDEFDTMLDLARAYIDMGDPESATNALEEVASAGNEQQRGEAQSLLDSVR